MMLPIQEVTDFLLRHTEADFRSVQALGRGWWSVIATTERDYQLLKNAVGLIDVQPLRVLKSGAVHLRFRFNTPLHGSPIALPPYVVSLKTEGNTWRWAVSYVPDADSTLVWVGGGTAFTYDEASTAIKQAIALHWKPK